MPMHTVKSNIPVCECCIIALANADTSGCEYTCDDHADRLCEWGTDPGEEVVPEGGRDDINGGVIRCFGCGDDAMQGGTVAILAPDRD